MQQCMHMYVCICMYVSVYPVLSVATYIMWVGLTNFVGYYQYYLVKAILLHIYNVLLIIVWINDNMYVCLYSVMYIHVCIDVVEKLWMQKYAKQRVDFIRTSIELS